jgi:hypothetical protein
MGNEHYDSVYNVVKPRTLKVRAKDAQDLAPRLAFNNDLHVTSKDRLVIGSYDESELRNRGDIEHDERVVHSFTLPELPSNEYLRLAFKEVWPKRNFDTDFCADWDNALHDSHEDGHNKAICQKAAMLKVKMLEQYLSVHGRTLVFDDPGPGCGDCYEWTISRDWEYCGNNENALDCPGFEEFARNSIRRLIDDLDILSIVAGHIDFYGMYDLYGNSKKSRPLEPEVKKATLDVMPLVNEIDRILERHLEIVG